MFTQEQRNLFPELNLPALQKYVSSLASQYPGSIGRIVLHRFVDPEHEYLLAFELSDDEEARFQLLNSMELESMGYEKHLPGFYLNREACSERDWLFLPIFERDPDYSKLTIEGGGVVLYDSEARGGSHNIPSHRKSGFYREGDFWRIVYYGKETTVKNTEGMYYLGLLLSSPNREISARELYASRNSGLINQDEANGELELNEFTRDQFTLSGKTYIKLKQETYKAYHEWQVAKQKKKKASAAEWKKKFESYKKTFKEYGIGVFIKRNGELGFRRTTALDKTTDKVRKAIDRARGNILSSIQDKDWGSEIVHHLAAGVKRNGCHFVYVPPDEETDWTFNP